jgi:hypothetical protein
MVLITVNVIRLNLPRPGDLSQEKLARTLIVAKQRICQNCRVRKQEITIEVILFEYSRRL